MGHQPPGFAALLTRCVVLGAVVGGCASPATQPPPPPPPEPPQDHNLFDARSLPHWRATEFGGEGEVELTPGRATLDFGSNLTGITWTGAFPTDDYQLRGHATRRSGTDFFFGLTFPVRDDHLTLILGGWGGSLVGLSCLDGNDASSNETTCYRSFKTGQAVEVCLTVDWPHIVTSLDGDTVIDVDVSGVELSLRPEVHLSRPLGIASFATRAQVDGLRWRALPTATSTVHPQGNDKP